MTTRKKAVAVTGSPTPVGGADAVPAQTAPAVRAGFTPSGDLRKGRRPTRTQIQAAKSAVTELQSTQVFQDLFGTRITSPTALADALTFCLLWSQQKGLSDAWSEYVNAQSALAWNFTLGILEQLHGTFQAVTGTDAALAKELPSLATLLGDRSVIAQKGVATKREAKKAAKKAESTASAATVATSPEAKPAPTGTTSG